MTIKLNLGSGDTKIEGFINVDHRNTRNVDRVDDVFVLKIVEDNSVDEIVASHVLEHACYDRTRIILRRWRQVLKPKGILWIALPNFEMVLNEHLTNYKKGKINWEYFNSRIFGNATIARRMYGRKSLENIKGILRYEIAFHREVFTRDMITDLLKKEGFKVDDNIMQLPHRLNHAHEICIKAINC